MDGAQLDEIDRTLLVISHACERAHRAAKELRRAGGDPCIVEALERADRALLSVHGELQRTAYFGSSLGNRRDEQLSLDAA